MENVSTGLMQAGLLGSWVVLAGGVWTLIACFPGERSRFIFRHRPWWLFIWLRGEMSLAATFLTGGPLAAVILWWLSCTGWLPDGHWLQVAGGVWLILLGVALTNAARKSRPDGAACATLVIFVTLLLLAGGVLALRVFLP